MTCMELVRKHYLIKVTIIAAIQEAKAGHKESMKSALSVLSGKMDMWNALADPVDWIDYDVWFRIVDLICKIYARSTLEVN